MSDDLFLRATKAQLRFSSAVGLLHTEQLWQLPIEAPVGRASLTDVATRAVKQRAEHAQSSELDEILGGTAPTPQQINNDLRVAVVKVVIAAKKAEKAEAERTMVREQEKARLVAALRSRELSELPLEDLQKRIDAL